MHIRLRTSLRFLLTSLTLFLISCSLTTSMGQESKQASTTDSVSASKFASRSADHSHQILQLKLKPIIERFRITLARPRKVLMSAAENLYIVDSEAGTILKRTSTGSLIVLAEDLVEPMGLAVDKAENVFVSLRGDGIPGQGRVVKITPMGIQTLFAENLSGPSGLLFDGKGGLLVAQTLANCITRIAEDGVRTTLVEDISTPTTLALDPQGKLYVASAYEGTLHEVNLMGKLRLIAEELSAPSDLAFDSKGYLTIANSLGNALSYLNRQGELKTYATVPKGTISQTFDRTGNLWLVNWDYRFLMKITMYLTVPCPHCGRAIPVYLNQQQPHSTSPKPMMMDEQEI